MPAKVNPVIPEYAMQLSYRIRGLAYTVSCAVAADELELNVMEPIIIDSLTDIFDDLEKGAAAMADLCVRGLRWDGPRREQNLTRALDRWVKLAGRSGYEAASSSAERAFSRCGPPSRRCRPARRGSPVPDATG